MKSRVDLLLLRKSIASCIRGLSLMLVFAIAAMTTGSAGKAIAMEQIKETIELPAPRKDSKFSIERALRERRSVREFSSAAISLTELSQLLWAAQGVTHRGGFRTAPSAGALYPLQLYVVVGNVKELSQGIYKYQPAGHRLVRMATEDKRKEIARAAWGQKWVKVNAILIVFAAVESRTTRKYGRRGIRYVYIELGHAAQNLFLQAQSLGLDVAVVGAFGDDSVKEILGMPDNERPLYLMPAGRRQ